MHDEGDPEFQLYLQRISFRIYQPHEDKLVVSQILQSLSNSLKVTWDNMVLS